MVTARRAKGEQYGVARRFRQLTKSDRITLEAMLKAKTKVKDIAEKIGVHESTIYREIKRGRYVHTNTDLTETERYSPDIAHKKYRENLKAKGPDLKIGNDQKLADFIEYKMVKEGYSVGAVLGFIEKNGIEFSVTISRPTLYRYIDLGLFLNLTNKDLPIKGCRKKKKKPVRKISRAAAGTSIEKRPSDVDTREEFGHWEMDTVVGKRGESKHSLLVLTERKTREELMFLLKEHTASNVVACVDSLERKWGSKFGEVFKSITVDNGTEFSDSKGLEKSVLHDGERTKIYYCHPYSSYERGSNENQNKLVRRKVPKGTNFDDRTEEDVQAVEDWINNYPRLLFGWETAQQRFDRELETLSA
jgi:IS30 family transposase